MDKCPQGGRAAREERMQEPASQTPRSENKEEGEEVAEECEKAQAEKSQDKQESPAPWRSREERVSRGERRQVI